MAEHIRRGGNASTLWYILEDESQFYLQGSRALQNPDLKNFLSCKKSMKDENVKLSFDISGMQTLEAAAGGLAKEQLLTVLAQVIGCVITVRNHGIMKLDTMELSPAYIFLGPDKTRPGMVYLPCNCAATEASAKAAERDFRRGMAALLKSLRLAVDTDIQLIRTELEDSQMPLESIPAVIENILDGLSRPSGGSHRNKPADDERAEPPRRDEPPRKEEKKTPADPAARQTTQRILILQCCAVVAAATALLLKLGIGGLVAVLLLDGLGVLLVLVGGDKQSRHKKAKTRVSASPKPLDEAAGDDGRRAAREGPEEIPHSFGGDDSSTGILFEPYLRLNGQNTPVRFKLLIDQPDYSIGRARDNNGVISFEQTVSAHHCRVLDKGGVAYIRDEGSTNGTKLNGKRLERGKEQRLQVGDKLKLAALEFTVDAIQ